MERSVVATCPGCSEKLRIPAQWAEKAVKCKKCGSVVRAKGQMPVAARANGTPLPVATPVTPPSGTIPTATLPSGTVPAPAAPYTPPAATPSNPYPAMPAYPAPPGAPPMVFDPTTGQWVPAPPGYPYPAAPGYPYPMPPGYPAPAPGAGAPPLPAGYAYPPGYAPPPGYPYPAPAAPAAYTPPAAPQAAAPAPARPAKNANAFAGMEDESRPAAGRRRRKRGPSLLPLFVVGGFLLLAAGGTVAGLVMFKDKLGQWAGLPTLKTEATGGTEPGKPNSGGTSVAKGGAPRRMLALSVTKYLYCNPLVGGRNKNGASEFNEAIKGIAFRYQIPDGKDNNQLYVVTDADGKLYQSAFPRPMLKAVILDSIAKFCETSRGQDRVVIYFGGHAMAKDGKGYLIPAEGDPTEPDTLIPLDEVWQKLEACPAQQKVVLFDVCRLSTDDNAIRPGSEPMSEELEKLLHTPPAGVQVVTSCSHGQTAAEFRTAEDADTPQGSAFLGALRAVAKKKTGNPDPNGPLPVEEWAKAAGDRLKSVLGARAGTPKVSGAAGESVLPDPSAAAPERFAVMPPPAGANPKDVKEVFTALGTPTLLGSAADQDQLEGSVFFPADALKDYSPDVPVSEIEALGKDLPARLADFKKDDWEKLKGQAHRVAALKALEEIRTKWAKFADPNKDGVLKDGVNGKVDDKLKAEIEKKEQPPIADAALELSELLETLTDAKLGLQKAGEEDKNKFWQATFRFALAQAKLRLAFIHEANLALGQIRTDNIPDTANASGLRLVQKAKMTDKKNAPLGKQALEQLGELAKEHKGTPFEVLAKQWRSVSLGLEWKPKKSDADTTMEMKEEKK